MASEGARTAESRLNIYLISKGQSGIIPPRNYRSFLSRRTVSSGRGRGALSVLIGRSVLACEKGVSLVEKTGAPKVINYRRPSLGRTLSQNRTLILMCLPAILFFFVFAYLPMPGAYIAFTNFQYNKGIFGSDFVGLKNFQFLFISGQLGLLLKNTVLYNLAFIVLGNVVQLAFAVLLNEVQNKIYKKTAQSIMFLPYFISDVLVSLLVYNLINYDYGFISHLVRGLGGEMPKVYQDANAWPYIIVMVNLWKSTGYGTVVYFAAITGMDASMMEAAQIDGATTWQRIRYITLPTLKPTVIILFLFAIGGILKGNFGLFYNLVGNNSMLFKTTDIIETYVYRSMMNSFNFSQSSAVGLFQSVVGFFIVLGANAFVKHLDPDYALF